MKNLRWRFRSAQEYHMHAGLLKECSTRSGCRAIREFEFTAHAIPRELGDVLAIIVNGGLQFHRNPQAAGALLLAGG
jgi:hypothetical protein